MEALDNLTQPKVKFQVLTVFNKVTYFCDGGVKECYTKLIIVSLTEDKPQHSGM